MSLRPVVFSSLSLLRAIYLFCIFSFVFRSMPHWNATIYNAIKQILSFNLYTNPRIESILIWCTVCPFWHSKWNLFNGLNVFCVPFLVRSIGCCSNLSVSVLEFCELRVRNAKMKRQSFTDDSLTGEMQTKRVSLSVQWMRMNENEDRQKNVRWNNFKYQMI